MVASGQSSLLNGYPWESLTAGVAIVIVVVLVNMVGERLASRAERTP
jgi:peptide/nickel transport system permease protein